MDKKIMIGVPTGEMSRHASFYDYYNVMDKPPGSVCTFAHGQSPAKARNLMIQAAFEHDCTHILFLDDDMAFMPDILTKLLAHDLDIVGGYYLMRQYPNQGLIFDYAEPDGKNHWMEVKDDQTGLIEVTSTGLGCILFKLDVFKNLEKPWVRLGEIESDGWCDDIGLFNRLRAKGYKIHVDLDVLVGHMGHLTISPTRRDGKWYVDYNTYGTENISFRMIKKE